MQYAADAHGSIVAHQQQRDIMADTTMLLFYAGAIGNFVILTSVTAALFAYGIRNLIDCAADPLNSWIGVSCDHAAVVNLTIAFMSPGMLISAFYALFRDSMLAARAHLVYLLLALLVSLVTGISMKELYGLGLFVMYGLLLLISCLSLRQQYAMQRRRHQSSEQALLPTVEPPADHEQEIDVTAAAAAAADA